MTAIKQAIEAPEEADALLALGFNVENQIAEALTALRAMPAEPVCERCNGSGEITVLSGGGPDAYDVAINCPACKGSGVSCEMTDAAGEAFNNTFHKVRAEVSMDWWQRIWEKAVKWERSRATPPTAPVPLSDETIRLAKVALHEMPRPSTDWHEAAKRVCTAVVALAGEAKP